MWNRISIDRLALYEQTALVVLVIVVVLVIFVFVVVIALMDLPADLAPWIGRDRGG